MFVANSEVKIDLFKFLRKRVVLSDPFCRERLFEKICRSLVLLLLDQESGTLLSDLDLVWVHLGNLHAVVEADAIVAIDFLSAEACLILQHRECGKHCFDKFHSLLFF